MSRPIATLDLDFKWHLFKLQLMHPEGRGAIEGNELYWTQQATPTSWSDTYELLLYMDHERLPRVHVLTPKLQSRRDPAVKLEHVYAHNQLCLYYPGQYDPTTHLADTVVPWAIEWLLHYETWSVTGVWDGGGRHPDPRQRPAAGRRGDRSTIRQAQPVPEPERSRFARAFHTLFPGRPLTDALNWR